MSRRKAALPPEFEPPRRPSRSQQKGVGPAAVLAAGPQQGQPLGQQGVPAAAVPSQPSLGNDQPQQDLGAAVLGSVLCQNSASGQQVWPSRCFTHVCLRCTLPLWWTWLLASTSSAMRAFTRPRRSCTCCWIGSAQSIRDKQSMQVPQARYAAAAPGRPGPARAVPARGVKHAAAAAWLQRSKLRGSGKKRKRPAHEGDSSDAGTDSEFDITKATGIMLRPVAQATNSECRADICNVKDQLLVS